MNKDNYSHHQFKPAIRDILNKYSHTLCDSYIDDILEEYATSDTDKIIFVEKFNEKNFKELDALPSYDEICKMLNAEAIRLVLFKGNYRGFIHATKFKPSNDEKRYKIIKYECENRIGSNLYRYATETWDDNGDIYEFDVGSSSTTVFGDIILCCETDMRYIETMILDIPDE